MERYAASLIPRAIALQQSLYQMNTPPRKLLVLDLDETLVHATATELEHAADFSASATCCPSLLTYL